MPVKYDQHFLIDESVADAVVSAARIRAGDCVVEIGPGKGVLTGRLLDAGAKLTVVEIDARLAAALSRRFEERGLSVVQEDFLRLDLSSLPRPAVFVSNLPYSVGTPILQRLLKWDGWDRAVLMFQKEVADRLAAGPGSKAYGILSLSVQLRAGVEDVCAAPKDCFSPPPRVDSSVVRLVRLPKAMLPSDVREEDFFKIIKAGFAQRRKKAVKSMASVLNLDREKVLAALKEAGIPEGARAEEIPLAGFAVLARSLAPFLK